MSCGGIQSPGGVYHRWAEKLLPPHLPPVDISLQATWSVGGRPACREALRNTPHRQPSLQNLPDRPPECCVGRLNPPSPVPELSRRRRRTPQGRGGRVSIWPAGCESREGVTAVMIYPAWVYTAYPPARCTATLAKRNLYSPTSACYTLRGGVASTRLSRRARFEEVVSRSLLREGCFEKDASRWFPS